MCRSTSSGWNRSRRHHWQRPRPRAHLDFAADRRPGDRRPRSRSGEARRVLPAVARSPAHPEAGHERHRRRRGQARGRHQGEQGGAEGVRRQRLGERDGDEAGPSPRAVPRGDEAQRVEAANLLAMATEKKILAGKLNGDIDLKGGGQGFKDLSKTLAGILDGHVLDGIFYGKDVVVSVTGPLAKSLPFGLAGKEGQGGTTSLGKDLPVGVTITQGKVRPKDPVPVKHCASP